MCCAAQSCVDPIGAMVALGDGQNEIHATVSMAHKTFEDGFHRVSERMQVTLGYLRQAWLEQRCFSTAGNDDERSNQEPQA